jgi:fructokinase
MSNTSTRSMSKADLEGDNASRKVRITSFGELLWDVFPDGARLGGAAANVAFHAAQLGAESRLISRVGRDQPGKEALRILSEALVLTEDVSFDDERPTGSVRVRFENDEPQFEIAERSAWDAIAPSAATLSRTRKSDVLCFSTLAQRTPLVRAQLKELIQEISAPVSLHGVKIGDPPPPLRFLDLNLRSPYVDADIVFESLAVADVVKMNEQEETWLRDNGSVGSSEAWLLARFQIQAVALTRGSEGARLTTKQGSWAAPGLNTTGGDSVGAGDAFVACLAVEFAKGTSHKVSLSRANEYAAWVASQKGAMPRR